MDELDISRIGSMIDDLKSDLAIDYYNSIGTPRKISAEKNLHRIIEIREELDRLKDLVQTKKSLNEFGMQLCDYGKLGFELYELIVLLLEKL